MHESDRGARPPATPPRSWRPPPTIANPVLRWSLRGAAAAFLLFALLTLEIDPARIARGLDNGLDFVRGFLRPDFTTEGGEIAGGLIESTAMAIVATVVGAALSIPIAYGAARPLAPGPVYALCRGIIVVARAFQEIIVAIILVAIVGFGPLAGILTLSFASIGFFGKLLAEKIEALPPGPLAAVRSTGAPWLVQWRWAIAPRVRARVVGLTLYRLDINFRESAIIGIVGAGGIGNTLRSSISRYDFDIAAAILLLIIGIVAVLEWSSSLIRSRLR